MIHPLTINDAAILIVGFIGLLAGAVAALTVLVNKITELVRAFSRLRRGVASSRQVESATALVDLVVGYPPCQDARLDFQFDGRPARTRTKPRYEISLGKDSRPERNNAVLRAGKVCCGRRGWEGAFVSRQEVVRIK
jgi:hypothetical protein